MCPQVSEEPKRAHKGITLCVKLGIIKYFDGGKQNKAIVHVLNFRSGNTKKIFQMS